MRLTIRQDVIENLTINELELLEEKTGRPMSRLFDDTADQGPLLHALAHIQLVREAKEAGEPVPTWEESGDYVPEVEKKVEGVVATTADPTAAGPRKRHA